MSAWEQVGICGVDAGVLMLMDPCYVRDVGFDFDTEVVEFMGEGDTLQLDFPAGHGGKGVVVRTGLGDGVYPVEARWEDAPGWGRRIAEVRVTFLPHPVLGGGGEAHEGCCQGEGTTADLLLEALGQVADDSDVAAKIHEALDALAGLDEENL
jgi:hypothetical protein